MKKKVFTVLKVIVFLGIGVFFIWFFVKDLSSEEKKGIFRSFREANYLWLFLSLLVALLSHLFRTLRWQMLLNTIGYRPRFKNTFLSLMIGYFANLALPRLGEVSRCGILNNYEKIPFEKSFGTVVGERAFDLLSFVVLFFLNLLFQYRVISGYVDANITGPLNQKFSNLGDGFLIWIMAACCLLIVLFFIFFHKRLKKIRIYQKILNVMKGFWEGLKSLARVRKPGLFLLYTILIWGCYYLMSYLCFFSLAETSHASPAAAMSVLVLGTIGIMVVQGGIGIYPVIVAETLTVYGIASVTGFALGWLIWGTQTFIIILAGIFSLILLPLLNTQKHAE